MSTPNEQIALDKAMQTAAQPQRSEPELGVCQGCGTTIDDSDDHSYCPSCLAKRGEQPPATGELVQFILNVCNVTHPDDVIGYDPLTQRERVREIINAALAAEREKIKALQGFAEKARLYEKELAAERERADHNADVADSIAIASKQVEDSLRQQLLMARDALEKIAQSENYGGRDLADIAADALAKVEP